MQTPSWILNVNLIFTIRYFEQIYAWSTLDFEFDNIEARDNAIFEGTYIAENNLPLGLEVWHDKVFITLPKWKTGIPATLATVPRHSKIKNPKLRPYPNWQWQQSGSFLC